MNNRSSLLLFASMFLASAHAVAQSEPSSRGVPASNSAASTTGSERGAAADAATADARATGADAAATPSNDGAAAQTGATEGSEPTDAKDGKRKKNKGKKNKGKKNAAEGDAAEEAAVEDVAGEEAPNTDEVEPREETLDGDDDGNASSNGTLGRFRLMYQLRYKQTYVDSAETSRSATIAQQQRATLKEQDGYDIQRAFLRYTAKPSKYVEAKFLVDFAELRHENVKQSFKLAYLQIHPTKRLEIDVGLLKRTYSLLELLPIVDHELADLGPTDSYIKDAGFGGRDLGAVVRYRPLPKRSSLMLSVGAFRGDIDEGYDSHPLKVVTARI